MWPENVRFVVIPPLVPVRMAHTTVSLLKAISWKKYPAVSGGGLCPPYVSLPFWVGQVVVPAAIGRTSTARGSAFSEITLVRPLCPAQRNGVKRLSCDPIDRDTTV